MRVIVGAGLVVALVAGLSGCGDDGPSIELGRGSTVALIGDSILFQSSGDVTDAFADAGIEALVEARPGAAIEGAPLINWHDTLEQLVSSRDPDVVVVELGTNGCGTCASLPEAIDAVLEPARDVPHVLWIDAREDSPIPDDPEAINDALRDAEGRWDNLTVIDFDDLVGDDDIAQDRVHLNEAGRRAFAEALVDDVT